MMRSDRRGDREVDRREKDERERETNGHTFIISIAPSLYQLKKMMVQLQRWYYGCKS